MDLLTMDSKAREMLQILNSHSELTSTTLATVFNEHYSAELKYAMITLMYLDSNKFVKAKTNNEEFALMIQITHSGMVYEQTLKDYESDCRKKLWQSRRWSILTMVISSILSVVMSMIVNLMFK